MGRTYTLTVDDRSIEVEVWHENETFYVRIGPTTHTVSLGMIDGGRLLSLLMDDASYEIHASPSRGAFDLLVRNELFRVEVQRGHRGAHVARVAGEPGAWVLRAPMSGIVADVAVAVGTAVERGTVLLILESMKMKNELRAGQPGTVERVHVTPGQGVERGDTLLQIHTTTAASPLTPRNPQC